MCQPAPGCGRAQTFFTLTLALRDARGTIEISGCVAGAGNAVILPELCLIGAHGAADAAVDRGVVVMTGRALDCRERGKKACLQAFCCTHSLNNTPPPKKNKKTPPLISVRITAAYWWSVPRL